MYADRHDNTGSQSNRTTTTTTSQKSQVGSLSNTWSPSADITPRAPKLREAEAACWIARGPLSGPLSHCNQANSETSTQSAMASMGRGQSGSPFTQHKPAARDAAFSALVANEAGMCIIERPDTHRMRTNIEIDDDLLEEAMTASGLTTKRATVEEALRQLVATHRQREALRSLAGIGWEGDLDEMRRDKPPRR